MCSLRLQRTDTLAVIVDVQERLFPHIFEHNKLEQRLLRLIQGLQVLDVPLVVTQQYTRGLGPTIASVQTLLQTGNAAFAPLEKMHFSCCGSAAFCEAIAAFNKVILCGVEAHVCVLQTALDLLNLDKQVIWVDDCIGSRKPADKAIAQQRLWPYGQQNRLIPSSYESLLLELCEVSGTPEFKALSALIKDPL